jgi:fructokinase
MRIGVDLGGTKIEAIALADGGAELLRRRVPTPREDYQATVTAIADLVAGVEAEAGATATVGVGMPGVPSPRTGLVKNANSTWLIGQPFAEDLSAALARDVRCANDANCFALSEAHDGAGAGAPVVFGVILGTGVGGGIVIRESILTGGAGVAGEWGHNPLPWPAESEQPGADCYCGKRGCIETWLSGPNLRRDHERHSGQELDGREIAAAAGSGDRVAQATLDRYVDRLARALATIVNVLDPDVIVLGGGVSNLEALYPAVEQRLPAHVFGRETDAIVRRAVHGDSSGVRGAAWLWG